MKSKLILFIIATFSLTIFYCDNPNYFNVSSFDATSGYDRVKLIWVNPDSPDFTGVMIRRSDEDFPQIIDDGDEVYTGLEEKYIDTDLSTNTTYYYSIFSQYDGYNTEPETIQADTDDDKGAFLIVNSWGIGGSWEDVPDGKYWMTFGAAKKVSLYGGFWEPPTELNEVKATISFNITHPYRSDFDIFLGVGDSSNPQMEKKFIDIIYPGHTLGDYPFPNNNIHLDISEFYSLMNDNDVYIKLIDKSDQNDGHVDTGTINNAGLRIWTTSSYDDGSTPDLEYSISNLPISTVNDQEIVLTFTDHVGNIPPSKRPLTDDEEDRFYHLSTPPIESVEEFRRQFGTYVDNEDYNKTVDGFGTGAIPPSSKEWNEMKTRKNYVYPNPNLIKLSDILDFFDNSKEIYFPPIGNQGGQGSCNSFVVVYYIHTFYQAQLNGYDLSGCMWDNGIPSPFQDKVMNPDFVFNIVCSGLNEGAPADDNYEMLRLYGTTTWDSPYDDSDWTSWPTEDEFIKAPINRIVTDEADMSWLMITSETYVDTVIQCLEEGILIHTFIDGFKYSTLSDKDVWTSENIPVSWALNHGNTIVGYNLFFDPENP